MVSILPNEESSCASATRRSGLTEDPLPAGGPGSEAPERSRHAQRSQRRGESPLSIPSSPTPHSANYVPLSAPTSSSPCHQRKSARALPHLPSPFLHNRTALT
eukprot:1471201-Rhodomonas_salina.7